MRCHQKQVHPVYRFFCLILSMSLIVSTPNAFATSGGIDPMNINANSLTPLSADCDKICSLMMTSSQNLVGIDGAGTWSTKDDQYCANHGSITNAAVGPLWDGSCTPAGPPYCCQASLSTSCNVPTCAAETDCTAANQKLLHCKLKNSQVESYCQSYLQTKDANNYNYAAIAMDGAVVVACTAACLLDATGPFGKVADAACIGLDVDATITEMVATSKLQSSDVMKTVSYAAASAGLLAGAGTAVATGVKIASGAKTAGKVKNGMACLTAVIYAALAIIRGVNIGNVESTHNSSCTSIQSLISNATTSSTNSPDIMAPSTTPTSGSTSSSFASTGPTPNSSSSIGSSTTNSGAGGGGAGAKNPVWVQCPTGAGLCLNAQAATAGDMAPIAKAKSDSKFTPYATKIQPQLAQQAAAGASGSQMISGLLGSEANTNFGKTLQKLADQVQKNPEDFMALFPSGVFSNVGHAPKKEEASPEDPFGAGFGAAPAPIASTQEMSFAKKAVQLEASAPGDDIFHPTWPGSIFDITTTRLRKVADRIDQLEWDTPLNRALNGLSRKK